MSEPERDGKEIHIDAQDARGAEIILRKRRNRLIFIAGLAGFVVLVVLVRLFG